ncbi:MAG: response regulator [Patescibacteria group bacterium]|jgi:DNA-binding response OmpR family regulator
MKQTSLKKVLIIEDDVSLLKVLSSGLSNQEFEVITAVDGEEGLAVALREKPNLILLDLFMPKMDGITMLKKLREDEWGKKVKVIILTNIEDREKLAAAVENRVYDYMIKTNWNISDVLKKIRIELKYTE